MLAEFEDLHCADNAQTLRLANAIPVLCKKRKGEVDKTKIIGDQHEGLHTQIRF